MSKKYLQDWYNNNISYNERERLNKIGIENYDYHYLQDLEQILRCENWAKNNSEIRSELSGRIKKIILFTPNFNYSYSYEKERIERYIREAENNRNYTRSKYQIEQEKFQERIVVYPKDWCRIS